MGPPMGIPMGIPMGRPMGRPMGIVMGRTYSTDVLLNKSRRQRRKPYDFAKGRL